MVEAVSGRPAARRGGAGRRGCGRLAGAAWGRRRRAHPGRALGGVVWTGRGNAGAGAFCHPRAGGRTWPTTPDGTPLAARHRYPTRSGTASDRRFGGRGKSTRVRPCADRSRRSPGDQGVVCHKSHHFRARLSFRPCESSVWGEEFFADGGGHAGETGGWTVGWTVVRTVGWTSSSSGGVGGCTTGQRAIGRTVVSRTDWSSRSCPPQSVRRGAGRAGAVCVSGGASCRVTRSRGVVSRLLLPS